jgi:YegS/Rv2252/BmrU family lipid kinase
MSMVRKWVQRAWTGTRMGRVDLEAAPREASPAAADDRVDGETAGRPKGDRCVTVIFNPVSGQGDPEERKRAIAAALAEHGYRCQNLVTSKEQGARYWTEQALKDGVDLVAVSGGDGTVVETMAALAGSGVPIAILPAGTGNLLSINLGLPTDVPRAVHAALFGRRRKLDLAHIQTVDPTGDSRTFAIVAGVGYDAWLIRDADRETKNRLGMGAYLLAALRNLKHRPVVAHVRIDGSSKVIRRRAKGVMVANMGRLQGNLEMVPDAWPDDGLIHIVILKAESLGSWLRLALSTVLHRLRDDPSIEYHRARNVEISLSGPQPLQCDGEAVRDDERRFTVEVVPSAVEVMVPDSAPV